jgi:RHO1 GDP-GTP exchange protein 1/2
MQFFIRPLRHVNPPVIDPPEALEAFIDEVAYNIQSLRDCNRRLLKHLQIRQREQAPIIQTIGDIFLQFASDFGSTYPTYIGHLPTSQSRLKSEIDKNRYFRDFFEV